MKKKATPKSRSSKAQPLMQSALHSRKYIKTKAGMRRTAQGTPVGTMNTVGAQSSSSVSMSPLFYDYRYSTPDKFYFPRDRAQANSIWRDMYRRDPTLAIATDMYSELPWSGFDLEGVDDGSIRKVYEDMFNTLNLVPKFSSFTKDFLITGELILHSIFNSTKGYWERVISHNPDYVRVQGLGLAVEQPLLWLKPTPEMRRLTTSADPRVRKFLEVLPREMITSIRMNRELPLDELNTTYIPRLNTSNDPRGTSMYTRLYRINMYEDFVINSSLAVSQRNAAPVRIFKLGDPEGKWMPTDDDRDQFANLLSLAETDPLSVIITHPFVSVDYVGVSDRAMLISKEWDIIERIKLLALGVSKAFLTGETSFACFEKGTPAVLSNGTPVPIEDIQIDDLVLDQYGKTQRVTNNWCEGVPEKILEFEVAGNRKFRVTPNHRFPAWMWPDKNTDVTKRIVEAKELRQDDFLKFPRVRDGELVVRDLLTEKLANSNRCKAWQDDEYIYLPILSIQEVPNTEPVYNLTVEGSHTYLVCDGIATCNSAVAGLQVLMERLNSLRYRFEKDWMIPKLCQSVAKMHEFYEKPKSSLEHRIRVRKPENLKPIVPKIKWFKGLEPTQDASILGVWQTLHDKGILSERTFASGAGLDLEVERRNHKEEMEYKETLAEEYNQAPPEGLPGEAPPPTPELPGASKRFSKRGSPKAIADKVTKFFDMPKGEFVKRLKDTDCSKLPEGNRCSNLLTGSNPSYSE